MKALVKKYPEKGLWFEDVPEPVCGAGDVKIKIHKTAICGTDLHIYNWDEWSQNTIRTPQVIGHEYVGEIVEVGENVRNWKIGQLVSGEGHIVCGKCRNCLAGKGHLCKETVGVGVNRDGQKYVIYSTKKSAAKATRIDCGEDNTIYRTQYYIAGGHGSPSAVKKPFLKPKRQPDEIVLVVIKGKPGMIAGLDSGIWVSAKNGKLGSKEDIFVMSEAAFKLFRIAE